MAKDPAGSRKTRSSAEPSASKPGKTLKPLTSFLSGRGSGSTSATASSSKAAEPARAKKSKANGNAVKAAGKASDAIELSSDDEIEDEPIKADASNDSDDGFIITGQSGPSASTSRAASKAKPTSKSASKEGVPTNKRSDSSAEPASSSRKTVVASPSKSEKAKGKQRAIPEVVALEIADDRDDALWSDKYAPSDVAGLSMHPKKVADVKGWLTEAYAGGTVSKYRRIMVLSGPAGSAKTATIRAICKEMNIELLEYKTSDGDSDLMSNQLPAFLGRATLASSLSFGTLTVYDKVAVPVSAIASSAAPSATATAFSTFRPVKKEGQQSKPNKSTSGSSRSPTRRMLLIEDLPNIFTSPATRTSFRSALTAFSSTKRHSASLEANANVPLVIIVSEALTRPGQNEGELAASRYQGSGEQSVSVRTVVPPDVLHAPSSAEFKFNPIAMTYMKKALNAVLDREYAGNKSDRPSAQVVDLVIQASDGDIRSALNTLQFLMEKSTEERTAVLEDAPKKGKKRKSDGKVKDGSVDESTQKALMHLVNTKEGSLFLFHALGKVLWNKRWGENPSEDAKGTKPQPRKPPKLPTHLSKWNRRASKVDASELFADAPVDADMFMSYLHQNYPPFCDDAENFDDLMHYLSDADALMRMEGDAFSRHALTSHYSFQVAVRGALVSLPSPPQRRGQKMYKSEVWEAQRRQRDNQHLISDWTAAMNKANLMLSETRASKDDEEVEAGSLPELLPSKGYLHLELLPFLGLIQSPQRAIPAKANSNGGQGLFTKPKKPAEQMSLGLSPLLQAMKLKKELLDIAFMPPAKLESGLTALGEKEDLDADEDSGDDRNSKPTAPAVKVESEEEDGDQPDSDGEMEEEKLYLSDDDIEDF